MTYLFAGTPEDAMKAFFDNARAAQKDPGGRFEDHDFHQAMICLVWLYERQAACGPVDPVRMQRFRSESEPVLAGFGRTLSAYVLDTAFCAEAVREEEELYEVCMRRSAIQSVLEDYAGTRAAALIHAAELEDLDAELRRLVQEIEPLPSAEVPRGLPDSHWWWPRPQQG